MVGSGRVECAAITLIAAQPPPQTVRAVFPHTAFLLLSSFDIHKPLSLAWFSDIVWVKTAVLCSHEFFSFWTLCWLLIFVNCIVWLFAKTFVTVMPLPSSQVMLSYRSSVLRAYPPPSAVGSLANPVRASHVHAYPFPWQLRIYCFKRNSIDFHLGFLRLTVPFVYSAQDNATGLISNLFLAYTYL